MEGQILELQYPRNSDLMYEIWRFNVWNMKENIMATNFEPHECVTFVQSTKIGIYEYKAIHSICT